MGEEESRLAELLEKLETIKEETGDKRIQFEQKRAAVDGSRSKYQQVQRNQFDAERKLQLLIHPSKTCKEPMRS